MFIDSREFNVILKFHYSSYASNVFYFELSLIDVFDSMVMFARFEILQNAVGCSCFTLGN